MADMVIEDCTTVHKTHKIIWTEVDAEVMRMELHENTAPRRKNSVQQEKYEQVAHLDFRLEPAVQVLFVSEFDVGFEDLPRMLYLFCVTFLKHKVFKPNTKMLFTPPPFDSFDWNWVRVIARAPSLPDTVTVQDVMDGCYMFCRGDMFAVEGFPDVMPKLHPFPPNRPELNRKKIPEIDSYGGENLVSWTPNGENDDEDDEDGRRFIDVSFAMKEPHGKKTILHRLTFTVRFDEAELCITEIAYDDGTVLHDIPPVHIFARALHSLCRQLISAGVCSGRSVVMLDETDRRRRTDTDITRRCEALMDAKRVTLPDHELWEGAGVLDAHATLNEVIDSCARYCRGEVLSFDDFPDKPR